MKILFLAAAAFLLLSISAFAQGDPDLGVPDSLIVDSVSVPSGTTNIIVRCYITCDDSIGSYNVPISWFPRESNVYPRTHSQYYYPLYDTWQFFFDTTLVTDGLLRQIGIYDIGFDTTGSPPPVPVVPSNNQRVHVWTMHFVNLNGAYDGIVTIDTVHDTRNGSLWFGDVEGLHGWAPKFKKGKIMIGYVVSADDITHPIEYALNQNYPNPFNPSTQIEFAIAKSGFVTLEIYDILGRDIKELLNSNLDVGQYSIIWDGTNNASQDVPSGAYFYKLIANDFVQTKKMLLVK